MQWSPESAILEFDIGWLYTSVYLCAFARLDPTWNVDRNTQRGRDVDEWIAHSVQIADGIACRWIDSC